ncbi:SDR family NAD(P)-dependent oxidoreductase [Thiomicrorhabdus sp. ZW0627]|uniref:SDR family NAD(P)-dependent oxidoreductase n=1 Tax=Thiomicrorhabdus sp. ZW0627 TaxID=3039774 RepID=UPI002436F4E9|nr:SDR family NAD(P)-dependent oxidoreductase [Thiomicrorhabdus sp. ZW0627]MDG6772897.1 SDR family NAD(P)-dependent oxidoreductase [Thiomicrorhabdus sp. ZW0627]
MSVYLVTGAALGLGKALSTQLIEQGHDVILLDKDLGALNKLYDELDSELAALYPMDLLGANIDHYQQLQDILTENYGRLDGVFLNAATLPAFTPIAQFDYKQWYEVLHTNLNANFHLMQVTLPLLLKSSKGQLVAVSDQNIEEHPAFYGAYGVAKAGLEQMIKSVAAEHRELPLECYLAKLEAFATEARGRLFPGENPLNLPTPEEMAKHIIDIVLHGLNAELVHKH